jgi:hypothetical protein
MTTPTHAVSPLWRVVKKTITTVNCIKTLGEAPVQTPEEAFLIPFLF